MGEISKLIKELEHLVLTDRQSWTTKQRLEILDKIRELRKLDPQNIDALYWEGMYYFFDARIEEALPIFEKVLQTTPNSPLAEEVKEYMKTIEELGLTNQRYIHSSSQTSFDFMTKIPCELIFGLKIIVLLIAISFLFPSAFFSSNDNKILKIKDTSKFETLRINPRSEYSFLTKKEVFDIRKKYVQNSIFAHKNYEPSAREFGSIANNKPWWGNIRCQELDYKGDYTEHIQGKSEQSLKINNPNMLVSLNNYVIPWHTEANDDFCTSEYSKFLPHSLKYDKNNKLLVIEYQVPRRFLDMRANISGNSVRFPIQLSGLNALDFGYKYVYAFDTKNVRMYDYNNNITKHIGEFVDYIHLGNSCKYKGGCNNISPVQFDKMIMLTDLPAEINLKLWKNEPINKYIKADIYYKIVFNELF